MSLGEISPAPKRSYDDFLQDIESGLRSGRIKTGDQLPGERILAETYSISRASVREAMRILDVMGILRSPAGAGPKSGALVVSEPSAGVSQVLRLHVASNRLPVSEIVETRILLESWAARTACAREDPAGLEKARELLAAMDKPGIGPQEFHALDAQFHLALSALAGNTVIETIMESLSGSIRDYIKDSLASLGQWPSVLETLREQHHWIFGAFEARDGEKAANLLREHVAWLYERTKDAE